jgi:hypothetical protein
MAVWEDHLLPFLTCNDAARLGRTCKALRVVARVHFKDLESINLEKLQAALTTFPRVRSIAPYSYCRGWIAQRQALVEWVSGGRHGGAITTVTMTLDSDDVNSTIHAALRGGALPSLKTIHANLYHASQRAMLTEGRLGGMHELHLEVMFSDALEPQLAALGLVRQLPALAKLDLKFSVDGYADEPMPQWPPFIPPSLKTLRILSNCASLFSLLRALPGMLGDSGAWLECLEINIPLLYEWDVDERLFHVVQALRCFSPTLKDFRLAKAPISRESDAEEADQEARLRVQWAEVLAGVSACRELEVLQLPLTWIEPLFPPGTAFARLTHLEIGDSQRKHPPAAGVMGLWEVMTSGGLPALGQAQSEARRGAVGGSRGGEDPGGPGVRGGGGHPDASPPEQDARAQKRLGGWVRVGGGNGQAAAAQGPRSWYLRGRAGLPRRGAGPGRRWGGPPSPPALAAWGDLRCH